MTIFTLLAFTLLVIGWVAAWLFWVFSGEIRNFLYGYIFPKRWRGGRERADIFAMTEEDMEAFLATEAESPAFVSGVLGCPGCLSAWVSGVGTVLLYVALGPLPWSDYILAPLIWASSAYAGHRLYHHI